MSCTSVAVLRLAAYALYYGLKAYYVRSECSRRAVDQLKSQLHANSCFRHLSEQRWAAVAPQSVVLQGGSKEGGVGENRAHLSASHGVKAVSELGHSYQLHPSSEAP